MAGLEFYFKQCIDEISAIEAMTRRAGLIAPESLYVLPRLRSVLEGIRDHVPNGVINVWGINRNTPLRTIASEGQYEQDNKGHHHVIAELTSIWEIEPRGNPRSPKRVFAVAGKASTCVRLLDNGSRKELAMWRMEMGGGEKHPGCYFHVQILGEKDDAPFPHSLSVPRFPSVVLTPAATLEFVLGELFQEIWMQEAGQDTDHVRLWRSVQKERLEKLLRWQHERVAGGSGSPWMALKSRKPPSDLFTSNYDG